MLAIDRRDRLADLHDAWHELPRFALVMFVSPNAVSHFFAARPATLLRRGWPVGTRAAATGPGSAQACRWRCVSARAVRGPHPSTQAQFDFRRASGRLLRP
jgi:uroporphyrinogen-III synthase